MELTAESIVFLMVSAITLGGGLLVVSARNLFHAGLYLMVALLGVAGLFVLLTAPFLAGVQVVVYVGAIAILIILAIMLTPSVTQMPAIFNRQWAFNLALAVFFFVLLVSVVSPIMDDLGVDDWGADFTEKNPAGVPADSVVNLGKDLVDPDKYMLPFEVASVLLMAALIGAVLLVSPGKTQADGGGED
ncbi:MAG: NADH-quinone oxidoreductase subunit J [Anaerolineae bacterium]|nr:NADH-quinone oxidoreductase subunit J [Anaerolineae bacterium]